MSYNVTATFLEETAKLQGAYPVDMYVVNVDLGGWDPIYYVNLNQDICGWALDSNGDVTTATALFSGVPIERGEINTNTQGEITEVTLTIPNTNRVIESVIQNYDYLRGREVYFISTFAKHLPSGGEAKYIGSEPDRYALLKEKLYVDSVTSNEQVVSFVCRSKFSIKNITLPRRTYTRECNWALLGRFKEAECDPTSSISPLFTTCNGTLSDCRARGNSSRFGGFPSTPRRGFNII